MPQPKRRYTRPQLLIAADPRAADVIGRTRRSEHDGAGGGSCDVVVGALRGGVRDALAVAGVRVPLQSGELLAQCVVVQKMHASWLRQQWQKCQIVLASAALGRLELDR